MNKEIICIAGDGWGAIAAFRSISSMFPSMEIITKDDELVKLKRANDIILNDMKLSSSKIIICAGYKPIIKKDILSKQRIINIHYSLLPKYRGIHSTVWAILNDEEYLGLSIHEMNEFIDDGPLVYQFKVENDGCSSATHYMNLFNNWISNNLGQIIQKYLNGQIIPYPQNFNYATWVGRRNYEDCKIDFNKKHSYLKNFFRALNPPYPLPFFRINGNKKCFSAGKIAFIERNIVTHTGRILNIDNNGLYISSKEGYVILSDITDEQGNQVKYSNFRIGYFLEP